MELFRTLFGTRMPVREAAPAAPRSTVAERAAAIKAFDASNLERANATDRGARAPQRGDEVGWTTLTMPLWSEPASTGFALLPAKRVGAPTVIFVCASAQVEDDDGPGRLGRALPLSLAEQTALTTDARAAVAFPWRAKRGLIVAPTPWDAEAVLPRADAAYVVLLHIDATGQPWQTSFRLVRARDMETLASWEQAIDPHASSVAITLAHAATMHHLEAHAGIARTPPRPETRLGTGAHMVRYLMRLEEAGRLALGSGDEGGLPSDAEPKILDELIGFADADPDDMLARLLCVETCERLARRRPELAAAHAGSLTTLKQSIADRANDER